MENHAALGLYTRSGFKRRDPFGNYRADPLSVFMQKDLSNNSEMIGKQQAWLDRRDT